MVKRSRHRPFTAVTRVRFPVGSPNFARIAQLVRAPASHAGGQRFESVYAHQKRTLFCLQTKEGSFQLSVPCGTISTPSVREAMLRIVKCLRAWVAHGTSLCAKHNTSQRHCRCFTWQSQTSIISYLRSKCILSHQRSLLIEALPTKTAFLFFCGKSLADEA